MLLITNLDRHRLELKFGVTIQPGTIDNSDFRLTREVDEDDWQEIEDPFRKIVPSDHFNSISRTLVLYFDNLSQMPEGSYRLEVSNTGIKNAAGAPLKEQDTALPNFGEFEYNFQNDTGNTGGDGGYSGIPSGVNIIDRSIKANAFMSTGSITRANPEFHIIKTDPENGSVFIEPDHNMGRVIVTFSRSPSELHLNDQYIKLQRKKMGAQLSVARWERVEGAEFTLDESTSRLHIHFPLLEEESDTYFESGYKYRVRLSAEIRTFTS